MKNRLKALNVEYFQISRSVLSKRKCSVDGQTTASHNVTAKTQIQIYDISESKCMSKHRSKIWVLLDHKNWLNYENINHLSYLYQNLSFPRNIWRTKVFQLLFFFTILYWLHERVTWEFVTLRKPMLTEAKPKFTLIF